MSTRVQLRLLIYVCLGIAAVNAIQWFLTRPAMPPLVHVSGRPQGVQNTSTAGEPIAFQLSGVNGEFYIDAATMPIQLIRRELGRGEMLHIWVSQNEYEKPATSIRPRAKVWRITRDDTVVLSEQDVFAAAHIGSTWRIIAVVVSFFAATWARVKLYLMRRNQMFDRMRRPAKPKLTTDPEPAKRAPGRVIVRN